MSDILNINDNNNLEIKIIEILKLNLDKTYSDDELHILVKKINSELGLIYTSEKILNLLICYLYKNGRNYKEYHFNLNKKHKRVKKYHIDIIDKLNQNLPNLSDKDISDDLANKNNNNLATQLEITSINLEEKNYLILLQESKSELKIDTIEESQLQKIELNDSESSQVEDNIKDPKIEQMMLPEVKLEETTKLLSLLNKDKKVYSYPKEQEIQYTNYNYEPIGTQWVHDNQIDDIWDEQCIKMAKQFDILRAIKLPEQRTKEWYEMRSTKITASDGGTVLGMNKYESQYSFILKKLGIIPFKSNAACYHGKKYEDVATMIYEYRMNVTTDEFGLIGHPTYSFLGASPDRICNHYKYDKKHKSKYVGRMLEIKCPTSRKIDTESLEINDVCPIYYWIQVQLQLECCDLEECDFWQCEIKEYNDREDFISDTNPYEPYRSLETNLEKGCVIQLLPKTCMKNLTDDNYFETIYENAKFIYPPKTEMSPLECDLWISETLSSLNTSEKYNEYFLDQVIYWKLIKSRNILIKRDREWFHYNLPKLKQVWNYVLFLQENEDKLHLFNDFIQSRKIKKNKEIMNVMDQIFNVNDPNYNLTIKSIEDNIKNIYDSASSVLLNQDHPKTEYMFIDIKNEIIQDKPTINNNNNKYVKSKPTKAAIAYMFIDD